MKETAICRKLLTPAARPGGVWGRVGEDTKDTDFSEPPTASPSPSSSLPLKASHHCRAGCVIQEVKIRSYSQKNVCHSVLAHCGPA